MSNWLGGADYSKRDVPSDAKDLPAWLRTEFGNIQRRLQGVSSRTITRSTTVLITDGLILVDPTLRDIVVTWPTPINQTEDWIVVIKRITGGAKTVTIAGTVDGTVNPTLATQWASLTIWSTGSALYKIASV